MEPQNQAIFYNEPPQLHNHNEYAGDGYPEPWRFDQFNHQDHESSQGLGSLSLSFDQLALSANQQVGSLRHRSTLASVPEEGQSIMGSESDDLYAAVHGDRHHEDEGIMSGEQLKQEPDWQLEAPEIKEEEDDLGSEYKDGDDKDDDFQHGHNIGTDHLQTLEKSWIPWEPYTRLVQLFNEDGDPVEVVAKATTTKPFGEETVNGHRHHVMYRRNYFRVEGQYCLTTTGKTTGRLYVNLDGDIVPVEGVCATVRGAIDGNLAREIEISRFTTGRDKLGEGPLTLPLRPSNAEPVFEDSTAGNGADDLGTWLRMQWRRATENNGARRSKNSSNYHIVMRLMVQVRAGHSRPQRQEVGSFPGTESVDIGYCMSGPIQARGRCPKTFEKYDPTNVDHKRRRPNKDTRRKDVLAKRSDSKTRIGKAKKQDTRRTRQSTRGATLLRAFTPSTLHTDFDRSLRLSTAPTSVSTSPPRGQAPVAPMTDYSATPSEIDALSDEEMGDFQRDVIGEFGIAGENQYPNPAVPPLWNTQWNTQREPSPSEGYFLNGVSAWAPPSENGHPDSISDMDLNLAWQ